MLLPGHHHRHTSSISHQAMGSGDVFQLLLRSFFTARTKVFFFPDSSSYRRHGFTSASFMEWAWQT
jgi:hypothetical protein